MLFTTPTQFAALALCLFAGWLFGLASHPGGKRAKAKLRALETEHANYKNDAELRVKDAETRAKAAETDRDRLAKTAEADRDRLARTADANRDHTIRTTDTDRDRFAGDTPVQRTTTDGVTAQSAARPMDRI